MNWGTIIMWGYRLVNKKSVVSFVFLFLLIFPLSKGFSKIRGKRKKMGNMTIQKLKSKIPESKSMREDKVRMRNVGLIKPPDSGNFYIYEDDPRQSEYNRLVDEEIKRLYKLSKRYRKSRSRGEIWLRLGERYVEKAQIIDFKMQDDYDKKIKAFNEGINQKTSQAAQPQTCFVTITRKPFKSMSGIFVIFQKIIRFPRLFSFWVTIILK